MKRLALGSVLILVLSLFVSALAHAQAAAPAGGQQPIIILKVGSQKAAVGSELRDLDVGPTILSSRTLVPLRFIAEALGLQVRWDAALQAIVLGPRGVDLAAVPLPLAVTGIADGQYVANAADFVAAVDWKKMQTVKVEMGEMFFAPKDLTFTAGQPYKLEIYNKGAVKHEFTADKFYRSIALRKAQDDLAEFKVPFLTEVEVFAGQRIDLYFVPLIPGKYELVCEIEGHREAGMEGTITVTGSMPATPAVQLGDVAKVTQVPDAAARVAKADWKAMETVSIELGEMYFKPSTINLKKGQPYKLELKNGGEVKHEADAADFFRTAAVRKAQDTMAEVKGPTFNEIEIFDGKQADLYLIPTQEGTFELACRIAGHYEAGMKGTIVVGPGQ